MKMLRYILRQKVKMAILVVLLILSPITTVFTGLWAGQLFDYAYAMDFEGVIRSFVLIFAVWIPRNILRYWVLQLKVLITTTIRRELKKDAFQSIMNVDLSYYEQFDNGEYLANLTNDVTIIDERYVSEFLNVLESVFNILTTGLALLFINRFLALTVVATGALAVAVVLIESRTTNRKNRAFVDRFAAFTQLLKEFFAAFPTIRNYSVESQFQKQFEQSNEETEHTKFVADSELQYANAFSTGLVWLMDFTVVGLGIAEVIRGNLTVGMVYTAYLFVGNIGVPLQSVLNAVNSMLSVKAVVEKFERLHRRARAEVARERQEDGCLSGDIRFENVSLRFGNKDIFRNVSFTFEKGKKYLIVGKNGAGKSTLFKLLKRRVTSYTGDVFLGEKNLSDLSNRRLAGHVSYLNENCSVISDTVRSNITLYRDYSEEELQQAVQAAHLELDLDHRIRDAGANISSGERRKIEIARALLSRPEVVIFDEVISTLDIESAYEIERLALSLDATVMFVSHNFSGKNIGLYDEILLLDDGQIVAHGSHEQLLQTCEHYRRLNAIRMG
ncbi:MAG: ABC transporter ATP-binding protein [Oscillospiraceae bacterium]|nr:ABC transporter ATP-binding protein [Oscillospiraceae bacterium]